MLTKVALAYAAIAIRHRPRYPNYALFVSLSTAHPHNRSKCRDVHSISSALNQLGTNSAVTARFKMGRITQLRLASSDGGDADNSMIWDQVLPYREGSHKSLNIDIPEKSGLDDDAEDPFSKTTFRSRLDATVEAARSMGKSSVWLHVPMNRASLIESMTSDNPESSSSKFEFHHAEGKMASLFLWLKDTTCKIPTYATHQLGVGALVVNSRNEVLCVREAGRNYLPWKIPGGLAELGEHIDQAAIREVDEETGIKCKFHSVLGVRHTHGLQFGRSDLYFVCRLSPIETILEDGGALIPEPRPQEGEISAVRWLPMEEYRAMINAENGHPMMQHLMKIYDQEESNKYDIQRTLVASVVPGRQPSPIYHAPLHNHHSGKETSKSRL